LLSAALGVEIDGRTSEAWYLVLRDVPSDAWICAVTRYLAEDEYRGLPPVGKLRRLAVEAVRGTPPDPEVEFGRVRRAVQRFGYMDPAGAREALGPTVWQAIEGIGGWSRVCESPVTQRPALYAQFRDAMSAVVAREESQARIPEFARPSRRIEGSGAGRLVHQPSAIPAIQAVADSTKVDAGQ
jgi:hypothetical protein